MCAYLYDVAGLFSGFYEHRPILSAENDAVRNSRLKTGATDGEDAETGSGYGYRNRRTHKRAVVNIIRPDSGNDPGLLLPQRYICNKSQGMTHFYREMEHLLPVLALTAPYH